MASESIPLLEPELLARLHSMRMRSRGRLTGALVGQHRSRKHGSSVEFAEHKEYAPGDELRHLDWRAYAKVDRYYVKRFEDETNLQTFLIVDASGSMAYGDGLAQKFRHASRLAAALAFLLLRDLDSVGMLCFQGESVRFAPPRAERSYLNELTRIMLGCRPDGSTRLAPVLEQILEVAKKRSLIVLLSDLLEQESDYEGLLAQLSRKHELLVLHTVHQDEKDFPFDGMHAFRGMESDRELVADPAGIRATYLEAFDRFREGRKRFFENEGIRYQEVETGIAIDQQLSHLLEGKG